jgi:hypothetical protein
MFFGFFKILKVKSWTTIIGISIVEASSKSGLDVRLPLKMKYIFSQQLVHSCGL